MTDQEQLSIKFSYENSDQLSALSKDELANQLIEFFEVVSSGNSFIDFDKLMGAGITLAKLGRIDISAKVVDWILSDQAPRRVDVGCAFLAGLWHPGFSKGKIDEAAAVKLMSTLELAGLTKDATSSFTYAVYQFSQSQFAPQTKEALTEAVKRIASHFAEGTIPKAIEIQLKQIFEKAA